MIKILKFGLLAVAAALVLFGLIQLIPYGHNHTNPPVVKEPSWDSPDTRAIAVRACFDCHSNETTWPWYTSIAPFSWLIQHDVSEGRSRLNFSDWSRYYRAMDELGEVIDRGDMPPQIYLITHPNANLSPDDRRYLIQGLMNSVSAMR